LVEQGEGHEQRRRGDGVRVWLSPPVEARAPLLILDSAFEQLDQGIAPACIADIG
jgi:hypothetical protein